MIVDGLEVLDYPVHLRPLTGVGRSPTALAATPRCQLSDQLLKAQARFHGRSMESEARAILTAAVAPEVSGSGPLGSRIAALFAEIEGNGVSVSRVVEPVRVAVFEA